MVKINELRRYYDGLSDNELEQRHREVYERHGRVLSDFTLPKYKRRMGRMLRDWGEEFPESAGDSLFELIREVIYRFLKEVALKQYLWMERTKSFGVMGEQRISITFCRVLLNIPSNRAVTQFDADMMRDILDDADKRFGKKTGDEYFREVKAASLTLFGVVYTIDRMDALEDFLGILGAKYRLFTFDERGVPSFIFGESVRRKKGIYTIDIIGKEFIRSPLKVLSIAASGYGANRVLIRRESCRVIFQNKWVSFYDQSMMELRWADKHPNSSIREGIKRTALGHYGALTRADILKKSGHFIHFMIDGILFHEMGHKIAIADRSRLHHSMASSNYKRYNIIEVAEEAIADWVGAKGGWMGSMLRFCEISRGNRKLATALFYVYLSDNWFVDEEEELLPILTDVLTGLALAFVRDDGSVDFEGIEARHNELYAWLQRKKSEIYNLVISIMKSAEFTVGRHKLNFAELAGYVQKMYEGSPNNLRQKGDLLYTYDFWLNMWNYCEKFSVNCYGLMSEALAASTDAVRAEVLKMALAANPGMHASSLREFIYEKYERCGVMRKHVPVKFGPVVDALSGDMEMDGVLEKVAEKFGEVMKGKDVEVQFCYDIPPDPFIEALQVMLRASGLMKESAFVYSGRHISETGSHRVKDYIAREIEDLMDSIRSGMYPKHCTLTVNDRFGLRAEVEECLASTIVSTLPLSSFLHRVTHRSFRKDCLFRIDIPSVRGVMDWSTANTIWELSNEVRPDEFSKHWTIDAELLEEIMRRYLKKKEARS